MLPCCACVSVGGGRVDALGSATRVLISIGCARPSMRTIEPMAAEAG